MRCFRTRNLLLSKKCVPLHCVFHSIRFKVNKGWSTAVLLFLCPYVWNILAKGFSLWQCFKINNAMKRTLLLINLLLLSVCVFPQENIEVNYATIKKYVENSPFLTHS